MLGVVMQPYFGAYSQMSGDPGCLYGKTTATFTERAADELSPDIDQSKICKPNFVTLGDVNTEPAVAAF